VASSNVDLAGTIDDFMLYDIALTPAEIVQLQDNPSSVKAAKQRNGRFINNPVNVNTNVQATFDRPYTQWKADVYNLSGQSIRSVSGTSNLVNLGSFDTSGMLLVCFDLDGEKFTSELMVR
jgi:hypothetical protein